MATGTVAADSAFVAGTPKHLSLFGIVAESREAIGLLLIVIDHRLIMIIFLPGILRTY